MTPEDPSLIPPGPVPLEEPLGSLAHDLAASYIIADDPPFQVAGRRARVTGGAARGADEVRVGPLRIATCPRLLGATCDGATITPLGLERRLRVGDAAVAERIVVPRDGPLAIFEWAAPEGAIVLDVEWTVDLASGIDRRSPAAADSGPLRWRSSAGVLLVVGPGGDRAVFGVGGEPGRVSMENASGDAPGVTIRARVDLPAGGSVRIAMAGGADDAVPTRALRSARFAGAVVQARRGIADRLRQGRLALETPDPALDRGLEWAKVRLADRDLAADSADAAARHGLDSLLLGDFDAGLETLRRLDGLKGAGDPRVDHGLHRRLAAQCLAWTGDIAAVGSPADGWTGETIADTDRVTDPAAPVLDRVRALLGVEPDATRGRLVLRPRPPAAWDRFQVRSLAMGDAAVALGYGRDGDAHRFVVRQSHGASPIRCILEPELHGRLRTARVDGVEAQLEPVRAGERSRVPVQLVLDHERVVELVMGE